MMVEDVDVLHAESPQALVEAGEEVLPGPEIPIGARPHVPARLGGDDKFVSVLMKVFAQDPSEVDFCAPIWGPVVVGQVEMRDTQVEGAVQDGALRLERSIVSEVLPQPEGHGRQQQAAPSTTAVR